MKKMEVKIEGEKKLNNQALSCLAEIFLEMMKEEKAKAAA